MSLNINYNDFKNICRTCLFNCDLKTLRDNVIIEVLRKIIGVDFETNDELPQQICLNCFEKIRQIQEFSSRCKEIHSSLVKCLSNFKNIQLKQEEVIIEELKQEINEQIRIKEELIDEEPKIEFVPVESYPEELKTTNPTIKQEIIETADPESSENAIPKTSEFQDNLPIASTSNTKAEKDKPSSPVLPEYPCKTCPKKFSNIKSLKRHTKNMHSGERPYECPDCSNTYTPSSLIKNQPCIHCGKRPFVCEICNKAFTAAKTLKVHKRIHSGELPYQCDICNRSFNCTGVLHNHKMTHSDLRPFVCDICSKAFKFADVLMRHKRTHSGECPYECDVCFKTFKNSSNLVRHKRIHSGERPHICDVCTKSFIDSAKLKKHKKIHDKSTIHPG